MIQENTIIRDYKIIRKIGEGGMGSVWLAEDLMLGRPAAIKALNLTLTSDGTLVERFRQEAKVQASLIHPNIVALYAFFHENGQYYIVMEYAPGKNLRDILQQRSALNEHESLSIFRQMLEGFGYAHQLGVVHRDIKPGNIIIDDGGRVKILDFGVAKMLGDRGLTKTGTKMGTIYYMSPEQVRAAKDIDQRSDIYSLGVTLYQMLAGKLPMKMDTESDYEVMDAIIKIPVPLDELENRSVPRTVCRAIERMTMKDREQRFSTCYQISEALGSKELEPVMSKPIIKPVPFISMSENVIVPEMIYVEGGSYEREHSGVFTRKKYKVTVDSFYIGKYPVTQREWASLMGNNPSYFKGDDLPVESVNWNDAQEYIQKLNKQTGKQYRLPTEAEWEYAARGGNQSRGYEYSGSNDIDEVAWCWPNSDRKTHPVETKQPNELGIYDMSGNVCEWCSDWYDGNYYRNSAQQNPTGPDSGRFRCLRGGSWHNDSSGCRVANRLSNYPDYSYVSIGFRVARTN